MVVDREYFTREAEEGRSYSRAVKATGAGSMVFLAGVTNSDENREPVTGPFAVKARAAFERLKDAVELAGGTLADIVTMTVSITDARYGDEFTSIRKEYFEAEHYPASALITVTALARPELDVEIQAIAVLAE